MADKQTEVLPDGVDDRTTTIPDASLGNDDMWTSEDAYRKHLATQPATPATPDSDQADDPDTDDAGDEAPESGGNDSIYSGLPFEQEIFGADSEKAGQAPAPAAPGKTAGDLSLDQLKQYFPGVMINTPEDLRQVGAEVAEMQSTLAQYDQLIEGNPDFATIARAAVEGRPLIDVVQEIYPWVQVAEPSKDDDPDAYVQAQLSKQQAEEKRKQYKERMAKTSERSTRQKETLKRSFGVFAEQHGFKTEDEKRKAAAYFEPFINGAATERGDFFEIIYNGVNAKALIEQAKIDGRNEAIQAMRSGKDPNVQSPSKQRTLDKALPLPHTKGSKGEAGQSLTKEDKELAHLGRTFSQAGSWWE